MPYRKYTRKYKPKTTTRRRYRRRNARVRRPIPVILPNRYTCKLRYVEEFTLDPSNMGTAVVQGFRANSLYDPNTAIGGGHQPMGFEQLCLMFNHFTVVSSKITVTCLHDNIANVLPLVWGIALTDDGIQTTGNTLSWILEQENTTKGRVAGFIQSVATPAMNTQKKFFSLRKFFNESDVSDDTYQCTSNTDPAEGAFYEIWACCVNGVESAEIPFIARIEYTVQCHEPKCLDQS